MSGPALFAATICLAAAAAYANHRYFRLPQTIALLGMALAVSLLVLAVFRWTPLDVGPAIEAVQRIDFRAVLMDGILPFLLFAGALHVDLRQLHEHRIAVILLATLGVVLATAVTGALMWGAASLLGVALTFAQALLFGALIAPTDPIAVLAVLREAKTPASLSGVMAGESLLNDGVGVVLFIALLGIATGGEEVSLAQLGRDFVLEAVGGIALGYVVGRIVCRLLAAVDDYPVEIFVTLAVASGSYALASALHVSGPLAVVVAGLVLASLGRRYGMSARTQRELDMFWEIVDYVLNAILFMLVGLEVVVVALGAGHAGFGAAAIAATLVARWMSVSAIVVPMRASGRPVPPGAIRVLTWGGLRGGISIALVLSLPPGTLRSTLLTATYAVVIFTMLVQGLTLAPLARRVVPSRTDS